MIWAAFAAEKTCGSCGQPIPARQPVALLTSAELIRCATCAERGGFARDETAITAALGELDEQALESELKATRERICRENQAAMHGARPTTPGFTRLREVVKSPWHSVTCRRTYSGRRNA